MEKVEDMLHRKGVIGGCNGPAEDFCGCYIYVCMYWGENRPSRMLQERNLKEVMVGHLQRALISYLEILSVTQLDRQESSLT